MVKNQINGSNASKMAIDRSKKVKKIQKTGVRIPVPPPGYAHRSKKDYNRLENKKIINKEFRHDG